jgi:hypothetical protein
MKRHADNLSSNEEKEQVEIGETEAKAYTNTFQQQAQLAAKDLVAKVQGGRALLNERHQEKIGTSAEEASMTRSTSGGFMSPSNTTTLT